MNLKVTDLRCQGSYNPIGIDSAQPFFSFRIAGEGRGILTDNYRLTVATAPGLLSAGKADMWDSGVVKSRNSSFITYNGKPLVGQGIYYWQVTVLDNRGNTVISDIASFETGFMDQEDWKAGFVAYGGGRFGKSQLFRKRFNIEEDTTRARCYMAAVGYFELNINGVKMGESVLEPGTTDWSKRILYITYDITEAVRHGVNTVGVMMGNGWSGTQKLMCQIDVWDKAGNKNTVCVTSRKGECWMTTIGPIGENSIYDGETYDARLESKDWADTGWGEEYRNPSVPMWIGAMGTEHPGGEVVAQQMEPIRATEDIKPKKITQPKAGVYVVDMGQNFSGWAQLQIKGERGTCVTMRFAEILYDNGLVNQENLLGALAQDKYICKGEGTEIFEPRFTYHGFRYVQVEGYPGELTLDNILGRVVRSDVPQTGSFACSDSLVNRIHDMIVWSEKTNQHSIPTDCPQRSERMGWINDMTVRCEEAVYNYNMLSFYRKWMDDIADTQNADGAIADTAPYRFGQREADPVCSCFLLIPHLLYKHYGDTQIIEKHYKHMADWTTYLGTRAEDNIVQYSYYGDWASPVTQSLQNTQWSAVSAITPGKLMSTGFYYLNAKLMAEFAGIIGRADDAEYYTRLAQDIMENFNKTFYNQEMGYYGNNSQASNAFALYLDIAEPSQRQRVADSLKKCAEDADYHFTTGNICTRYVCEMLTRYGHMETAYKLLTAKGYPSYEFMLENGATTVWERWENATGSAMNSHNHGMYGAIDSWLYKAIGGIEPETPGYESFSIKPFMPEGLEWADVSLNTVRGKIVSSWKKEKGNISMNIEVPANTVCRLSLPLSGTITENGQVVWESGKLIKQEWIISGSVKDNRLELEIGSGEYSFSCIK